MNKGLEERIRAGLAPHLEPGEQLLSVSQFDSGGAWTDFPHVTVTPWWGGMSDRGRLLLVKVTRLTAKPVLEDGFYAVPRADLTFHKTGLFGADLLIKGGNGAPPARLHFAPDSPRKEFQELLAA